MNPLKKPTAQERLADRIERSLQSRLLRAVEDQDEAAKTEVMRQFKEWQERVKAMLAKEGI